MTYMVPGAAVYRAESLMTDTVSWSRAGATSSPVVIDAATGKATSAADVVVFVGPCRRFTKLLPRKGGGVMSAGDWVVGEGTFAEVPLSAPLIRVNDIGVVTASVEHPDEVGLTFRVSNLVQNTQSTKQRLMVEAVID